jgi:translocation and assembly module TamB
MRWRTIIARGLATIGIVLLVLIIGSLLFLRTPAFQRLAIRTIVKSADESTGGHASVGRFEFHLSSLTAQLYDVTFRGTEPLNAPPLLHVDEITVGLKIKSMLQRKFTLTQLVIERPLVFVEVNRQGESNLPQAPKQSSSNTDVFELAVRHVLLTNGQIQYDDKKTPIDADLYNLRTNIHFEPTEIRYVGALSYDNADLRYGSDATLRHSLNARFSATLEQFLLQSAELKIASSVLSAQAELTNYANPTIEGRYDLRIHTQDFSPISRPVTPMGDVSLNGRLHYHQVEGQALLHNISLDGQLASRNLFIESSQGRVDLRALQGRYTLANGNLEARDIVFETLGGKVSTNISLEHVDAAPDGEVQARLRGISLGAAQRAMRRADVRRVIVSSSLDGTVAASWTGGFKNVIARTNLNLNSGPQEEEGSKLTAKILPVSGSIHASYHGRRNIADFQNTSLRIPSATASLRGEISQHSKLQVQATTSDLHGLAEFLGGLGIEQAASLEIAGSASLKAQVQGRIQQPELSGEVSAKNLQLQGSAWRNVQAGFQASSSQIALSHAVLVSAQQGQASLTARVGLRNWQYLPANQVAGKLSVQKMSIADLQRLANAHYPLAGELSAEVSFQGSQLNPAGSGSAKIYDAQVYGQPLQLLAATFSGNKTSVSSNLSVKLTAGTANATLTYTPGTKAYVVRLNSPAMVLQKLQTVQEKNLGIDGTATLSASGQGTLENPQLDASIEIPQLQLRDKSISQIKAQIQVANHLAELHLNSQAAQATIHSQAKIALSGSYYTEATIDTSQVPLEPLLTMFSPNLPQGFQGETELHATLKGPLKDSSKIEAHISIPILKASYQSLEIGAAAPIHADYADSVITLQPAELKGTDTSLRLQGTFPLSGHAVPNLTAKGSIDVRILKIIEPDVQSSGTVALDIHASGSATNPAVQGQLRFQEVALSAPAAPLSLQKLNGTVHIVDNSLQLAGLTGEVGGGEVSAGGSISYRPDLQFNVTLQGKSVRLRYPAGLRSQLDGSLVFTGTQAASTLTGLVLIDSLSFTPDFDISKFSDQLEGNSLPSEPGFADNIKLAVGLQSKSNLSASSSQISIAGDVNLRVVGTATDPVLIGRTDLTSGELFYRNVRYQLQRGIITFNNPVQTEPTLDISATTTVEQYNLTLSLRGPLDKLTTAYSSDPPLATADIISLIANGQTTSEASAQGSSTDSIVASQVAGEVTGGIQHLAGISSLQIDPLLGGNQNPSARVAIQQRVSKDFLFTFSTDLSEPGTEIVQGDYQINNRWSVSVTRDEVGGISVDGKYHTSF